jgi:PAS domain S-box-containing protein
MDSSLASALPVAIAVVDHDGRITLVNDAWRNVDEPGALAGNAFDVGGHFGEACQRTATVVGESAVRVAGAMDRILAGRAPSFIHEYECGSAANRHWCRLTIMPLGADAVEGATITHLPLAGLVSDAQALDDARRLLHESEERLGFALGAADIGDWSTDLRTNVSHRSLQHDRHFGFAERLPDWSFDRFLSLVVPEDRDRIREKYRTAMSTRTDINDEYRTQWPDGSVHWLWTLGRFYYDEHGTPYRVAGIVMDITDRKTSEQTVADALVRLTEAQRVARIGDWGMDLATQQVTWSAQVYDIMGRDPSLGPPTLAEIEAVLDAASIATQSERIAQAIATRTPQEYELTIRHPDGTLHYSLAVAVPRINAAGDVVALYGTVQDITERKKAEMVSERLASIVSSSEDAIIGKDLDGIITTWNRGAEKIFGYAPDEAIGKSIQLIIPDDRRDEERHILTQVRSGNSVEHFETMRRRKDGRLLEVNITASPIRTRAGVIVGVSKVARDISDRKRLEQQFLRAQRMESIGTLAGGIAHDLNNVLTPILLSIELLRMKHPGDENGELLEDLHRSASHGADMVRQLLSFARGVEGQRIDVTLRHVVHEVEKISRDTFLKHIDIRVAIAPDLRRVVGDPTQLHQVLLNLCVNARDAMPHGGILTISADNVVIDEHYAGLDLEAKPGPYVMLRVVDTGVGIPADRVQQIFDPFFTTKEVGKGTGLGLSTSQAIVKSHGGFIRVYSEVGRGSTFSVYLPAKMAQSTVETTLAPSLPRGSGEMVLVVDDEASVRQVTQQTLEAFGYRALVASDGAEAVALYARRGEEINIVITDIMMPIMDGPSAIRVLRRLNPQVRIIAASGLDARDQLRGLDVRFVLAKPFAADTLLTMLRAALTEPAVLRSPP